MLNRTALLLTFYLFLASTHAQNWEPVGGGITCPDNIFEDGSGDFLQIDYKAGSAVYALCAYGQKLYAGGLFRAVGNLKANNIARWDGNKWDSLGCGTNGRVTALGVHINTLVVGGTFEKAGGKYARGIVRWYDTLNTHPEWHYFRRGLYKTPESVTGKKFPHVVKSIIDYGGETYIGGNFTLDDDGEIRGGFCVYTTENEEEKWMQVHGQHDSIRKLYFMQFNSLAIFNNKIYLAGDMFAPNDHHSENLFTWDGVSYKRPLESHQFEYENMVCSAASDSGVYIVVEGYNWTSVVSCRLIRLKADGSYTEVRGLEHSGYIATMLFYNGKLYVAGHFDKIDGKPMNNIACWDGKNWEALSAGLSKKSGKAIVYALCIYKGDLYAAGNFDLSGNTTVLNIAKYNLEGNKTKVTKKK